MFERFWWRIAAVCLFLLAFFLLVGSTVQKSATVDEPFRLFRGVAFLREGATHFLLGHPMTASVISALPVLTEPNLALPTDTAAWESGNWSVAGDMFMWQLNANPQRILFLGRFPVLLATLLIGALTFRWARRMAGRQAGLLALLLLLFNPNMLAYGRIINGDAMQTLFFMGTLYLVWEWSRQKLTIVNSKHLLLAGACLGMAAASKFNGVVLVPILALILLILAIRWRQWRVMLALLPLGVVSLFVVWGVNGFAIRPFLGGPFWNDLLWVLDYNTDNTRHGVYFAGQASVTGWWYYFPVAFLVKTPLVILLLLGAAGVFYAWGSGIGDRGSGTDPRSPIPDHLSLFLLLPALIYLLAGMVSALNIGFRYMLPLLPLLTVFTAVLIPPLLARLRSEHPLRRFFPVFPALLVFQAIVLYPHFIPYFNSFAGGTQNGWRLLSDSNVDWGQDLPALAQWQQETGNSDLSFSYFGTAHPSAYGVQFSPLPSWTPAPEQGNPATQQYNLLNPAPGLYAISVTNLHGVVLGQQRDLYAAFREQEPMARIGNSIFIYEVTADGDETAVTYSNLRPMTLDPTLQLDSNNVRVLWFEQATSFIWPAAGGWMMVDETEPHPALAAFWPELAAAQTAVSPQSTQFRYPLPPPPTPDWFTNPQTLDGTVSFLGAKQLAAEGGQINLLTAWRSERPFDQSLNIFVHALDADGEIIGQWDGLDSDFTAWSTGDVFVQFHSFAVSGETAVSQLATGLYNPTSGERLGERLLFHCSVSSEQCSVNSNQ